MDIENYVIIVCILVFFYLYSTKKENFYIGEIPLDLTNKHSLCPSATLGSSYPKCVDGESLGTGRCYSGGRTVNMSAVDSSYVPGATNSYKYYRCTNPRNPFKQVENCPLNATKIVNSDGVYSQCFCKDGFQISDDKKSCNCPTFYQLNNGQCEFKPLNIMSLAELQTVNSMYNNSGLSA